MTNQLSAADLSLILRALVFASEKHRDQRRKNATAAPYINHPIAVADLLCNEAGIVDTETLCAALLHDTLEDTDTTVDELKHSFGEAITNLVIELTDDKTLSQAFRKQLEIEHAPHLSPKAKLVRLADKISNLSDVEHDPPVSWDQKRRRDYFDFCTAIVAGLRGISTGLEEKFDAVCRSANRAHEAKGHSAANGLITSPLFPKENPVKRQPTQKEFWDAARKEIGDPLIAEKALKSLPPIVPVSYPVKRLNNRSAIKSQSILAPGASSATVKSDKS